MKFRNHETGEVLRYRDIIPVLCKSGCDNCPIIAEVLKHDDQSCQAWILNHPHEAAQKYGIKPCTIRARIEHGWAPERAVSIRPGETVKLDDIIGGAK